MWSLRNLNCIKSNKVNLIIPTLPQKRKKKKRQIHGVLQFLSTNKMEKRKEKELMINKVKIENAKMKIINLDCLE